MLSNEPTLLTLQDVRDKRFPTVRMQLGYEMREMDVFLAHIENTLKHYESGGTPDGVKAEEKEDVETEKEVELREKLEEAKMRITELEGDLSRTEQELEEAKTASASFNENEDSAESQNDSMFNSLFEDHEEKQRRAALPEFDDNEDAHQGREADSELRQQLITDLEEARAETQHYKNAHAELSTELQRLSEELKKQQENKEDAGNSKSAARMLEIAEKTASQLIADAEEERQRLISGAREGTEEEIQQMRKERAYLIEVNKNLRDLETTSRQRLKDFFSSNLNALDKDPLVEAIPDEYTKNARTDAHESLQTGSDATTGGDSADDDNKGPSNAFLEALQEVEGQPNPYAHMLLDEDGNALALPEHVEEDNEDEIDQLINAEIEAFRSSLGGSDDANR